MTVVTRFAPSPTGYLHIGGARTALFNWLHARKHGGQFLLRIEDTDRKRHSDDAVDAILRSLRWLGLDWDGEPVYQSERAERHKEAAHALVASGHAYYCYASSEELEQERAKAAAEGKVYRYPGTWRDRDPSDAPQGVAPAVRLRAPRGESIILTDLVQGTVSVEAEEVEDFVILRSDGTPTYMLAVVADDLDMGVTCVLRGDDHLTNTFKQILLYRAMGKPLPEFGHIPLIHGPDGAKLSKRHGAMGADEYERMGYLPEAMRNYLLRLGWSSGDLEILDTEQAVGLFSPKGIGRGPARFDMDKLNHVNAVYLRAADDEYLYRLIRSRLPEHDSRAAKRVLDAMSSLKARAVTLNGLAESALFLLALPAARTPEAEKALEGTGRAILGAVISALSLVDPWERVALEAKMKEAAAGSGLGLGKIMAPVRAAVTGSHVSPSMFEVMEILGREETIKRLMAA